MRGFTPQQATIALLIGDRRGLSYEQIGQAMTPRLTKKTVKAYARAMCELFDDDTRDAHPPRLQILVWIRHLEWELGRQPCLEEVIRASAQRDA